MIFLRSSEQNQLEFLKAENILKILFLKTICVSEIKKKYERYFKS